MAAVSGWYTCKYCNGLFLQSKESKCWIAKDGKHGFVDSREYNIYTSLPTTKIDNTVNDNLWGHCINCGCFYDTLNQSSSCVTGTKHIMSVPKTLFNVPYFTTGTIPTEELLSKKTYRNISLAIKLCKSCGLMCGGEDGCKATNGKHLTSSTTYVMEYINSTVEKTLSPTNNDKNLLATGATSLLSSAYFWIFIILLVVVALIDIFFGL